MLDVAIIGAGPYGLSLAAHAKEAGLNYRVFGYPMDFWKTKMPPEMFIRTLLAYTGLSDSKNEFTLHRYQTEMNITLSYPLPRSIFVDYGLWFTEKMNLLIETVYIEKLENTNGLFRLETEGGKKYIAKKVIVAVGLTNAQYIPKNLSSFPETLVSHTSNYTDYLGFKDKSVAVIGGGQSAWETAALLYQSQARVELIYRRAGRLSPPEKNMNEEQRELADKFYFLSQEEKNRAQNQFSIPTVSDFLVPLVEGKVKQRPNTSISHLSKLENDKLRLIFNDQSSIVVDHVIAATGYRFSLKKLPFLHPILNNIQTNEIGEPIVNQYFESTLSDLFFAGPATASQHGPTFRFISGVWHTSDVLINYIQEKSKTTNLLS
ncbi:NAD(P)-binding domain-containing protein [Sporosarcina sp. CAU 1771]